MYKIDETYGDIHPNMYPNDILLVKIEGVTDIKEIRTELDINWLAKLHSLSLKTWYLKKKEKQNENTNI